MTQDLERRIVALETRLEFQEDTIARLNDALVDQQHRLSQLERHNKRLVDALSEHGVDAPETLETPPPHY